MAILRQYTLEMSTHVQVPLATTMVVAMVVKLTRPSAHDFRNGSLVTSLLQALTSAIFARTSRNHELLPQMRHITKATTEAAAHMQAIPTTANTTLSPFNPALEGSC